VILVVLLGAYLASGFRGIVSDVARRGEFDPFLPAARAIEHRIGEGRFAEALPLAIDLRRIYPREPQIALWIARIHHGLNDAAHEAAAWEAYVGLSPAPAEACPALPEAYARSGRGAEALPAYERCTAWDRDDAEVLIDLGDAYLRANRARDARVQYERARQLDPANPIVTSRLVGPGGGPQ